MLREIAAPRLADSAPWQDTLGHFETVDLSQISSSATDDRIDTKFILRDEQLLEVLGDLVGKYRVLDVDGKRFSTYRTQYFDTESFSLFRRHHAGGSNRYKVRARTYLNTQMSYVEIKRRTQRGTTTKLRHRTESFETLLLEDSREFVDKNCQTRSTDLLPALLNNFDRIHLVSPDLPERLTLDLNIEVETETDTIRLPGVAVAEFKQDRCDRNHRDAEFLKKMRAINVRPTGFSKYCMCLLLTTNEIKHNRFKPQLRRLNRLMEEPNALC